MPQLARTSFLGRVRGRLDPAVSSPGPARIKGGYESYYLRAVDPDAPRAVWIRHTVLQRPGGAPAGSLWCTVWDAATGPPVAVKATPGLAVRGDWLETAGARFGAGRVTGEATAGPHRAAWDFTVARTAPPLRHLPHPLMYDGPLPLATAHGGVYELGTRERDHGVRVAPFPDP
jgi:hypothetical protein